MPLSLDLMPVLDKEPEPAPPKTIVVRYGYLKLIGEFPSDMTAKVGCGSKLVLRTDRGTELGEMLTTVCGNGGCNKSITRDKMLEYIQNSGGNDFPFSNQGRVLRLATIHDLAEQKRLDEQRPEHLQVARELVQRLQLPMKIVEVEHLLGGERIVFYFTSEQRVDFRNLVRDLAHAVHTRIELRQVGARDEARLVADYEKCGQHCCCKQFLKVLTPISMRSAKVQKATLDPAKISGRCGRLMCCLRYEDQTYEELRKRLPKRNSRVKTAAGIGWVLDGQILTQLIMVQYDDGKRAATPMEEILEFDLPKPVLPGGQVMQGPNDRPPEIRAPEPEARRGAAANPSAVPVPNRSAPPSRDFPRNQPGQAQPPSSAPPSHAVIPQKDAGPRQNTVNPMDVHIEELMADAMDNAPPRREPSSAPPPPTPALPDAPPAAPPSA